MDLSTSIDEELWGYCKKNYEGGNFKNAILDSFTFITDLVRNKTGLEGDGANLIGQAFGGEDPKIQINKLQTTAEKDAQKGVAEILRGIYLGIRNPRSHDLIVDTKEDADSIIIFINYLNKIIDKSKSSFEESIFIKRVFDKFYVMSNEYSELLIAEIPKRKRVDIGIIVIKKREYNYRNATYLFMSALFLVLTESEKIQIFKVISDELKYTTDIDEIETIINISPGKYWNKVDKPVRLRIENILLDDLRSGRINYEYEDNFFGSTCATLSYDYLKMFDVDLWTSVAIRKLDQGDPYEKKYIDDYIWGKICHINREDICSSLKNYFLIGFNKNVPSIINRLDKVIRFDIDHPWWKVFENELKDHPEIEYLELPF